MVAPARLNRITVQEAVTLYLRGIERAVASSTLSPVTQSNYTRDLTEFVELVGGETVLDDLTSEDVDDLVLAYAAKPDARYTRNLKVPAAQGKGLAVGRGPGAQMRFRASISRLFAHADRKGWVQQDPMPDTLVRPKARDLRGKPRTALPQHSAEALLKCADAHSAALGSPDADRQHPTLSSRDAAILRILLEVGPRVSELSHLDRDDLDYRQGHPWLIIRNGKGGKRRELPLSEETATAVKACLAAVRPTLPASDTPWRREDAQRAMFVTYRGRRIQPRDVQNIVHRAVDRLPEGSRRSVTPHGLRHTCATLLLASGAANVRTVQAILGHASLATTGIYLDEVSDDMIRAVSKHPVTSNASRIPMRQTSGV
jgi:site-specific recombinase XerD